MTSRERLLRSLNHQDGPLAVDFGSTGVTGMHVSCVAALREHYGLDKHPVKVWEPFQMLGELEDDLLEALGVDVVGISGRTTMFGFPNEGWHEWRCPWGQDVLVPACFQPRVEATGDLYLFPEGDDTAPPSGHLPSGGYFFDAMPRAEAIDEDPDPADNCEEFKPLKEADWAHWERQLESVRGGNRGVNASLGGTGFGDIALVPAPFLKRPKGIRNIAEWYMLLVEDPDYVHAIFSHQCDVALANLERFAQMAGNLVDILFICGTDFGTQDSQFCSRHTFDELWAPYYRRVNDWVNAHTEWKTFKHTCGAVYPLIPHLIEVGFDILNPVQCSARDMAPERLKAEFGQDLTFWGGGVDTQKTLPFGTPEAVRTEVLERCRVFAPGGGFVFNTVHNIQARTPTENIVAMMEALKEYRGG